LRYNQDLIEQIRDANNIVDIIGQYTELKGRGHQYMGLCPFPDHNEKSPSFSVSESKQLYHCFGCKKSGNLFTFLENHDGMSFTDALEFLARRAGIALPEPTTDEGNEKTNRATYFRINNFTMRFYQQQLKNAPADHPVKKYLAQRGLTDAIVEEMKLGYASEEWSALAEVFESKSVPMADAERLGLIKPKKQKGFFDLFRHRLMFPILSQQDEVVGFGGRVLDKEQKPKYLNSPESPVFAKGKTFYALNWAAKHIRNKDRAVIVEGYMDGIALHQAGIQNVVATLGTALTEDHARLIKKYTSQVVLMFDGDFAGQTAAERSLMPMFAQGLCPLAVFLPDDLDPDDYVKKYGPDDLLGRIDSAQELFILTINQWLKDFKNTANEKLVFMERVAPFLNAISDAGLRVLYVREVAQRLSVDEKWVLREMSDEKPKAITKPATTAPVATAPREEIPKVSLAKAPPEEAYLVGIAVNSAELLVKIIESGVVSEMTHSGCQTLLKAVIDRYGQNPSDFDKLAPLVVSLVNEPEELTGLFKFWSLTDTKSEAERVTLNCIKRVKERHLKRQSQLIAGQLQNSSEATSLEKLEQIMNVTKNRIQLNRQAKGEP